jgi:hypothetical protein
MIQWLEHRLPPHDGRWATERLAQRCPRRSTAHRQPQCSKLTPPSEQKGQERWRSWWSHTYRDSRNMGPSSSAGRKSDYGGQSPVPTHERANGGYGFLTNFDLAVIIVVSPRGRGVCGTGRCMRVQRHARVVACVQHWNLFDACGQVNKQMENTRMDNGSARRNWPKGYYVPFFLSFSFLFSISFSI